MRPVIALLAAGCGAASSGVAAPRAPLQPVDHAARTTSAAWSPPQGATVTSACPALFAELEAAYATSNDIDRHGIVEQLLADPPEMPAAQLAWCAPRLRTYSASAPVELDREARATLRAMASAIAAAYDYDEPHALCPPAAPLPAQVPADGGTIASESAAWDHDPGWRCMRFLERSPQHFQYEVQVDAAHQSFAAIARRRLPGGAVHELVLRGVVDPTQHQVTLAPVEAR